MSTPNELMIVDSIIAGVEGIFKTVMDNQAAKAMGQEYFSILLSLKSEEVQNGEVEREIDGTQLSLRVHTIAIMALKSAAGASDSTRLAFQLRLNRFIDAIERGAKAELVNRYKKDLRHTYFAALDNDIAQDQNQLRGAFDAVAKLSKILSISNRVEAVDRFKHLQEQMALIKENAMLLQQQQQKIQQPEEET